jgi:hypothetical protein
MATIPGTNVAAMIVPFDTADIYATHCDKYGQGGYRVVNTILERDQIATLRRSEGMWVKVLESDKVFELWGGIENANWREVVLSPAPDTRFSQVTTPIINPGETVTVDALPVTYFRAVKWMFFIESENQNLHQQYEISAHVNNTEIFHTKKYAMLGDKINVGLELLSINNGIRLSMTNNESTGILITVLRLPILR